MDPGRDRGDALVSIRLYVEGGGDSKKLKIACRKGFSQFLEKAGLAGRMPRIVACGGRENAYESFKTAQGTGDGQPMLLVDAEGPVLAAGPWQHLGARDGWNCPGGSTDHQCHLMVQVMESWFLADRNALTSFYGGRFKENALPGHRNIEQVPKQDVLRGLEDATRRTRKGPYSKGAHSFDLLGSLDPGRVEGAVAYAKRFLDALRNASA